MSATTGRRRLSALLVAAATAVPLLASFTAPATPAAAAPAYRDGLNVAIVADFDPGDTTKSTRTQAGIVAGPATGTADPQTVTSSTAGFTYRLLCTTKNGGDCFAGGTTTTVTWTFTNTPDTPITTTGIGPSTQRRAWKTPGIHPVAVTVDQTIPSPTGETPSYRSGQSSITTAVSPTYADVSLTTDPSTNAHAAAVWTTAAYTLVDPCRTWVPSASGSDTETGQAEFCRAPNPARAVTDTTSTVYANPVTGNTCTSSDAACGLLGDTRAITNGGDPTGACSGACLSELIDQGTVNAESAAPVDPRRCEDNVVAVLDTLTTNPAPGKAVVRGTEPGCATYHDALAALVAANDTKDPAQAGIAPADAPGGVNRSTFQRLTNTDFSSGPAWNPSTGADSTNVSGGVYTVTTSSGFTLRQNGIGVNVTGGNYTAAVKVSSDHSSLATLALEWKNAGGATVSTSARQMRVQSDTGTLRLETFAPPSATTVNWSLTLPGSGTSAISEPTLADGSQPGTLSTSIGSTSSCSAGPEPDRTVARAYAILGDAVTWCNSDRALTKRDLYTLLARASGDNLLSNALATSYRDLVNPNLSATASSDSTLTTLRGKIGALLASGVPAVGDLRCPGTDPTTNSSAGTCFNVDRALTREDLSRALAASIAASPNAANVRVDVSASKQAVALGNSVSLSVTATVPAYTTSSAPSTVAFTAASVGGGSTITCADPNVTISNRGVARTTCTWTAKTGSGPVDLAVQASYNGSTAIGYTSVTIENKPPVVNSSGLRVVSGTAEETSANVVLGLPYNDPEGSTATAQIRSCDPGVGETCPSTGATFAKTGKTRTTNWSSQANTEVGTVAVESVSATKVRLRVNIYADPVAGRIGNGPYAFKVRVCDSGAVCTDSTVLTPAIAAVNTAPTADTLSVETSNAPKTVPLSGNDNYDIGWNGSTSPITGYKIDTLPPRGTIECRNGGTGSGCVGATWTATTNTTFVFGTSTEFRWNPPTDVAVVNDSFTYRAVDSGVGTGGSAQSAPATVFLRNALPDPPPVASLTTVPTGGSVKVIGDGAATVFPVVNSGQSSTLSAWVYSATAGNYRIRSYQETPSNGNATSSGSWVSVPANTWTKLSATRTSGGGENSVRMVVEPQNNSQTFWIDDADARVAGAGSPQVNLLPNGGADATVPGAWLSVNSSTVAIDMSAGAWRSASVPAFATAVIADGSASSDAGPYGIDSYAFGFGDGPAADFISSNVEAHYYTNTTDTTYPISLTVRDTNVPRQTSPTVTKTVTSVRNFVTNPNFDSGTNGWAAGVGQSVAASTPGRDFTYLSRVFSTNANSATVTGTAGGVCTLTTAVPSVDGTSAPGQHNGAIWLKAGPAGNNKTATLTLSAFDQNGTALASSSTTGTITTAGWTKLAANHTISSATNKLSLTVTVTGAGATGTCFSADDAAIWRP